MNAHAKKTREAILGAPAPRNLEWKDFEHMWEAIADEVKNESGDRLSVSMNGHREVFRRPHDGKVSIEDVENARHLLHAKPIEQGSGSLLVVTVDAKRAEIIEFDLDSVSVDADTETVRDKDPRARRLRAIERKSGDDDAADLDHFYKELAAEIRIAHPEQGFVLLGHGHGKSDVAESFEKWIDKHEKPVAERLTATGSIDLSAANDRDIQDEAKKLVGQK